MSNIGNGATVAGGLPDRAETAAGVADRDGHLLASADRPSAYRWEAGMSRVNDDELIAAQRERAGARDRVADRTNNPTSGPTGTTDLRPVERHFLDLQRSAGNQAVIQLLRGSPAPDRAEDGDDESEGDVPPDWSAPIEQEADDRSERRAVQRHADEETVPDFRAEPRGSETEREEARAGSDRSESRGTTAQRQAAAGAPAATFPTFPQIRWNATVSNAMWAAWAETLRASNATSRREQGFWVQWDRTTTRNANGDMRVVGAVTAPAVGPAVGATVNLGARPADAGDWVTVGSFHTHTPTRHRTVGRVVGPSGADNTADTNDNVAGLVYDYTAVSGGAVPARHPTWSAAQVYHSGPNSRV